MMMQRLVSMSSVSLILLAHPQPGSSSEETTEAKMLEPEQENCRAGGKHVNHSTHGKVQL